MFNTRAADGRRKSMFAFIAQAFRSLHSVSETSAGEGLSPAAALMESAGSRAGVDARQAQELRSAASAWLSVVR
jgi:hypothetical protein